MDDPSEELSIVACLIVGETAHAFFNCDLHGV